MDECMDTDTCVPSNLVDRARISRTGMFAFIAEWIPCFVYNVQEAEYVAYTHRSQSILVFSHFSFIYFLFFMGVV